MLYKVPIVAPFVQLLMTVIPVQREEARSHRPSGLRALLLGAMLVALPACGPRRPGLATQPVDALLVARTGVAAPRMRGVDSLVASDSVRAMLARPLTPDAVVRVTLLARPRLRSLYEEIGLAQADVVQAGLLSNPLASVDRFTEGRFQEFSVALSFVELLRRPLRTRVARARLETTTLQVADAVFRAVTDARSALAETVAAEQSLDLRRRTRQAAQASATTAALVHQVGNLLDLDLASERARAAESDAAVLRAEGEAAASRERLVRALGVDVPGDSLRLPARLADLAGAMPPRDSLVALAVNSRLDLAAALSEINASAREVGLTSRFRYLADGSLAYSGEAEGSRMLRGPGLSVPLPLFDRGQARLQRAQVALRQAVARQEGLIREVRSEVRESLAQLDAAQRRATRYQADVLPLRQRVTRETQLLYNSMAIGVFGLLAAQQAELEAGQGYIESLRDYWIARYHLEQALGTRIP